ncbi:hypothetical protein CHARACLAT_003923 [Characodon lateralis]|uniref:Uncharacterized protein n=1 Tax=Characodon lateralis TaxID=208331 RepID=A0ABU7D4L2_9TELE|nr:hypothetical protein [Characodon lateralis]
MALKDWNCSSLFLSLKDFLPGLPCIWLSSPPQHDVDTTLFHCGEGVIRDIGQVCSVLRLEVIWTDSPS